MLWFIGPILAIVALVLASSASNKIKQSGGRLEGEGLAQAARIVAWIHLGIAALVLLVVLVAVLLGAALEDDTDEFNLAITSWQLSR